MACPRCPLKSQCTTAPERRITRWQQKHVLEAVQRRLDENPQAMRQRRETAEHPFAPLKMRMGATHFLMKGLPKVRHRDGTARFIRSLRKSRRNHNPRITPTSIFLQVSELMS